MDSNNLNYAQPAPEPQKKGFGKGTFLIIGLTIGVVFTCLLFAVVMTMKSKKAPAKLEGAGYESAEEAVEAYVNFLKEENFEGIISTFAVESYLDNYDMEEYFDYVQTFNVYAATGGLITTGFYSDSDFSRDLTIESRRAYILSGIHRQLLQVMVQNTDEEELAENVFDGAAVRQVEDVDTEAIMNFLSTDLDLDTIELGHYRDEKYYDIPKDSIKRYLKDYEDIWGAELEMVTVELEIDDEDYTLFMLCVCYDGKWYVADFNNPITLCLGISPGCKGLVPAELFKD